MLITGRAFIPDIFKLLALNPSNSKSLNHQNIQNLLALNPSNLKSSNHQNIQNGSRPRRQSKYKNKNGIRTGQHSCTQVKNMLLNSNKYFIDNHKKPIAILPGDRYNIMMSCI